jgi:GT2 family glycosyltransferase
MLGITGEDDDFANRMRALGVPLQHSEEIVLIHQNHSEEDTKNSVHSWRFDAKKWNELRRGNVKMLREWFKNRDPIANKNINWGNFNAIIKERIIGD